jgi:hypothetical protein
VKLLPAAASCEARKRERQVQSGAEGRRIGDDARNVVCLSLQVYHYRRHRCVIEVMVCCLIEKCTCQLVTTLLNYCIMLGEVARFKGVCEGLQPPDA